MQVIYNARIHTQNPAQPQAGAIALDRGRIIAVGSDDEIIGTFPSKNKLNADGHTIIPGLTDAHIHLESFALNEQRVDCETPTQEECLQRVALRVKSSSPGDWILGHGWNQNRWSGGFGSADQLDKFAPQNPVFLTHKSLHCAWVNNHALRLAGINRHTTDPTGGRIGRAINGEPDGILFESAMELIEKVIPEPTQDQVVNAIRLAQQKLWGMGLTGVHDFDQRQCFSALQVLLAAEELKLRILKSIPLMNLPDAISLGLRSGFGDDMLRIGSVKLFSDGALGPQTAAMLQPYEQEPGNRGILLLDAEELYEHGRQAVINGISMAVHAIGDRANHEVLNAYAQLRKFEQTDFPHQKTKLRHRIEHVQVIHPDDIKRISGLNIIASMQPIHATSDMLMADRFWGRRANHAYAWHELITSGAQLAFGSDAPVESPNPFWGIHAAVTRRRADGTPSPDGWYPEQRISLLEAIDGFTTGPAYAACMENRLGRLSPGFLADLVILNQDPFYSPPDELLNCKPLATMVAGEWVYSEIQ